MVLPLIPLALIGVGVVSGASGAALGLKGGYDIKKATDCIRKAGACYDEERRELEAHELVTNAILKTLGTRQEQAINAVVERMADFLRRHAKQVSESEKLLVDGLDSTTGQVKLGRSLGQDAVSWMRGIVGAAVTGVGINTGITTAVTTFAAASTGTAISTLSGAAMTNATLAVLGGGSIASGGGGMAIGAAALNFVTIGPAILVSGLVVAGQGEKAKSKARENEAEVNVAIAEMQATKLKFDAIVARAEELEMLLDQLVVRATSALDLLESEPFDPAYHAARFQQALTLTVAVRDATSVQVVDESGELNQETAGFKMRYRTLIKETVDV
ncbi:hypothetical protein [Streptomyces sp. NPDC014746]|uniref:hypothetical protein n=1 Tax=Streptomyces sp. NPDC014746 TaxID=3364904 RepID=UPI0036FE06BF